MFTIDASVHINALNTSETGSAESREFLARLHGRPWPVFSPTLMLVEVAAAVARATADAGQGRAAAGALRGLAGQSWVPMDESLAQEAAELAAENYLRGADAVYAAVARHYGTTLVTRDRQQLERIAATLNVVTPEVALDRLRA